MRFCYKDWVFSWSLYAAISMLVALIMDYVKFLGSHLSLAIENLTWRGLWILWIQIHTGSRVERSLACGISCCMHPYVKLATKRSIVLVLSRILRLPYNLLNNHDKICNNPCRWRSNLFLQRVHVMWYNLQDFQGVCMRCYMLCNIYSRPACHGRHDDWSHMIVT